MPEHRPVGKPSADADSDAARDPATVPEAITLALEAYDALCGLAETIVDEWTYVTALAEVGRGRIRNAASSASPSPPTNSPGLPATALRPDQARAIRLASAEIRAVTDPHRAIDWLSTFPAVVELAFAPGPPAPRQ